MASLLFKKGSYDEFKSKVLGGKATDGTLYLTEDEGSLYVGKSDGSVLRVQGTVHQYETLTDFSSSITPPYSTDVIYFIAEKNALVRWDGSTWVQLNATAADTASEISRLEGLIGTNKTNITNLTTQVGTNTTNIGNHATLLSGLRTDVDAKASLADHNALAGRVTTAEGEIDTLQEEIEKKATKTALSELSTQVGTNTTNIADLTEDLSDLSDVVATKASLTDHEALAGRVTTAEGAIAKKAEQSALEATNGRVTTLETQVGTNTTDIGDIKEALDTKAALSDLNALAGRVTTAEGNITTLQGEVAKKVAQSDFNTLSATVSQHTTALGTKVDKVDGKGLSTNDYTDAEKTKLAGIAENATHVIVDETLSTASTNAILNKAVATRINELNTTIGQHTTALGNKVDKVDGKGLSTNDYTTTEKNKLAGIAENATRVLVDDTLNANSTNAIQNKAITTKINSMDSIIGDHTTALGTKVDKVEGKGLSTNDYTNAEKTKLANIAEGATRVIVDEALAANSTNPVQNKAVYAKFSSIESTISGHTTAIGTLTANSATKTELANLETTLKAEIDNDILAANAMTYKGGVNGVDKKLPTSDVSIGDTYVVTDAFGGYQPGDFLIAQGTETNGVITGTITWDHVAAGYSDMHDPKLGVTNNKIILKDFGDEELGVVEIASTSENITVTTSGNIISIGMEWGSF